MSKAAKIRFWLGSSLIAGLTLSLMAEVNTRTESGAFNPNPPKVAPLPDIVYQPRQKSALQMNLPRLVASERSRFEEVPGDGRQKIGIHRRVPFSMLGDFTPKLQWHNSKDGIVAYATISSAEAKSIRALLDLVMPPHSKIVFFGIDEQDDRYALDTLSAGGKSRSENEYWTPPANGEKVGMEIHLRDRNDISQLEISIVKVGHRFRSTHVEDGPALELECDTHSEAACGLDNESISLTIVKSAVKLLFEDTEFTYVCSGNLMNVSDGPDVFRPYVLTASHCISEEAVADSLVVHWFYETESCSSTTTTSDFTETFGGADVLESREQEDMTLLELERDAPEGAWFAGWSSSSSVLNGSSVNGAHHPDGALKKYLTGTSLGSQNVEVCSGEDEEEDCFTLVEGIHVSINEGAAEGGSSGSGLAQEIEGEERIVGVMSGASEGCSNQDVFFGRFANFYPHITTWFDPEIDDSDPGPDPPPSGDDHGDTTDTATILVLGDVVEGEIDESDDVDVFQISIWRRGTLTVYTEGSMDTEGELSNEEGTFEETDDDSGEGHNFRIEVKLEPGIYYLEVSGWEDSTGEYDLYTEFLLTDYHGDDVATATRIDSTAMSWKYDTPGKIDESWDVDVFEIELEHPSQLTVYTDGSTDTNGRLEYDSGHVIEENDDISDENTNFYISEDVGTGIYFLFVEGVLQETEEEELATYQLKVEVSEIGSQGQN